MRNQCNESVLMKLLLPVKSAGERMFTALVGGEGGAAARPDGVLAILCSIFIKCIKRV